MGGGVLSTPIGLERQSEKLDPGSFNARIRPKYPDPQLWTTLAGGAALYFWTPLGCVVGRIPPVSRYPMVHNNRLVNKRIKYPLPLLYLSFCFSMYYSFVCISVCLSLSLPLSIFLFLSASLSLSLNPSIALPLSFSLSESFYRSSSLILSLYLFIYLFL